MKTLSTITILSLMALFSSCSGQKEQKHIYLAGYEAVFNGDDQCQKFMETQVVDKRTAYAVWSSIELVFRDDTLVNAYDIEDGRKSIRELKDSEIGLEYPKLEPHQIYTIRQVPNSDSYIGGEIPSELTVPRFEFNAPFQYLGKLSRSDQAFSSLPFDLHLVAPIYLNFEKLFIDYSDPLNPEVLNIQELRESGTSYEELQPNSEVVYEKTYIATELSNDFGNAMGHTGVPNWVQYPDIPVCPKSGNTMKFLCQLTYEGIEVITKRTNVEPSNEWYSRYFDHLNFWGDGDLFIFFEPESKVACFFIQNT